MLTGLSLVPGRYTLMLQFGTPYRTFEIIENIPAFEITPSDYWGSGELPRSIAHGVIVQDAEWSWTDGQHS